MSGHNDNGRMSTAPSDEPFDEDEDEDESDIDYLDYVEGTAERQELINELNLTLTPEERDKTMATVDMLIALALENRTSDDDE